MMITIRPLPMRISSEPARSGGARTGGIEHCIDSRGHLLDRGQVTGENVANIELGTFGLVLPNIEQLKERRRIESNPVRQDLDHFALGGGNRLAEFDERVPE